MGFISTILSWQVTYTYTVVYLKYPLWAIQMCIILSKHHNIHNIISKVPSSHYSYHVVNIYIHTIFRVSHTSFNSVISQPSQESWHDRGDASRGAFDWWMWMEGSIGGLAYSDGHLWVISGYNWDCFTLDSFLMLFHPKIPTLMAIYEL